MLDRFPAPGKERARTFDWNGVCRYRTFPTRTKTPRSDSANSAPVSNPLSAPTFWSPEGDHARVHGVAKVLVPVSAHVLHGAVRGVLPPVRPVAVAAAVHVTASVERCSAGGRHVLREKSRFLGECEAPFLPPKPAAPATSSAGCGPRPASRIVFGPMLGPFPPAVAHGPLLSAPTAAIE